MSTQTTCGVANPGGQPCTKPKGHLKGHDPESYGPQPAPDAEGEWRIDEVLKSLFTNGAGEEADRLLLIKEPHSGAAKVANAEYLGGYSKAAVRAILKNSFGCAALASTQEK